jgi:hypothetical protein
MVNRGTQSTRLSRLLADRLTRTVSEFRAQYQKVSDDELQLALQEVQQRLTSGHGAPARVVVLLAVAVAIIGAIGVTVAGQTQLQQGASIWIFGGPALGAAALGVFVAARRHG